MFYFAWLSLALCLAFPKMNVFLWFLLLQGSKHKLIYDGMWHFDIPKCRDIDGGKIEVIARNSCGEAYATTTLTINPRQDDYRSILRHNVKRKSRQFISLIYINHFKKPAEKSVRLYLAISTAELYATPNYAGRLMTHTEALNFAHEKVRPLSNSV